MSEIAKMLDRIEFWCQENQKEQYRPMKPGLTKEEINSILGNW